MSISTYLQDTKVELSHVTWPSRKQSIIFTLIVIAVSLFVSFFLGFFDYFFSKVLSFFVS